MQVKQAAALTVFAMGLGACAELLVFPDWTITIPAGTPVREYEVPAAHERDGARIELVEDLVIGNRPQDEERTLYRARGLAVDDRGRIYVLDAGNYRVLAFDADGTFVRSFGGQGQGPGELMAPEWITVAGESIVVNDFVTGRFSMWSLEGDHLGQHDHGRSFRADTVEGTAEGRLIAAFAEERAEGFPVNVTAEFTLEGEEISRLSEVPIRGLVRVRPGENIPAAYAEGYNSLDVRYTERIQPRFALGRGGATYLAAGDEYQLLALDETGEPRWALRTTLPMPPYPIAEVDERVLQSERFTGRSDFDWDELLPAIESIRVDGHGHMWVYPTDPDWNDNPPEGTALAPRAVDVYSSDGELLFSGQADPARWHVALGDFVYRLTSDPDTGEQIVVRERLLEPF